MRSDFCVIRGKAHIALEQRQQAKAQWIEALAIEPKCVEPFELLQYHSLLTSEESNSLIQSLKYSKEDILVQEILLGKSQKASLNNCTTLQITKAENYFNQYNFQNCFKITNEILQNDPYNYGKVLLLHVSSLVELKKKNELFLYAHQLADALPSSSISYFAIGSYYYCTGDYEKARSYFR